MVFAVVVYRCESWTIRKAGCQRIDAFELWCWRVPWTARSSNQSILKKINLGYSLEELMLKLKLQYFGHQCEELTHWKRTWCWERLKAGGGGDDRGWDGWWHHWLNRHEFEQAFGGGEGQGSLGMLQSMVSQIVRHKWVTEQQKSIQWFI